MTDHNGNDYKNFTKVIDMFSTQTVIKFNLTMSDGQTAETEVMSIMKALEYVAQLAGKCFSNGTHIQHVTMDDVGSDGK